MKNTEKQKTSAEFFGNPSVSEREKYKYYIQNNASALALKEKIKKVLTERGLTSNERYKMVKTAM